MAKTGVMSGQMIKDMENKTTTLEIKTDNASYTIPAKEVDIDAVSK